MVARRYSFRRRALSYAAGEALSPTDQKSKLHTRKTIGSFPQFVLIFLGLSLACIAMTPQHRADRSFQCAIARRVFQRGI